MSLEEETKNALASKKSIPEHINMFVCVAVTCCRVFSMHACDKIDW